MCGGVSALACLSELDTSPATQATHWFRPCTGGPGGSLKALQYPPLIGWQEGQRRTPDWPCARGSKDKRGRAAAVEVSGPVVPPGVADSCFVSKAGLHHLGPPPATPP